MENKEVNRKSYKFQNLDFVMKKRSLEVRKNTYLLLNDFLKYTKENFENTTEQYSIAAMTYLSDEEKLKELFTLTLDGEVDKIDYNAEEDEKYMELIKFAVTLFMDFFSVTLPKQT